jgi:polyphosphate kinase 2 (PPK2 family)
VNYVERFKVPPGTSVKLKDIDPTFKNHHEGHKEAAQEIEHDQQRLRDLQELLYADGRRSLLICLQGMDTGGKDGTINHVLGAMNPQGCRVVAFKQPTAKELGHDFLWRVHPAAPARGEVVIFNRSHPWRSWPWICAGRGIMLPTKYGASLIPNFGKSRITPGLFSRLSRGTGSGRC